MDTHKQMVTFTLAPEVMKRLKAWIARQDAPPKQNAVVEAAITAFLDSKDAEAARGKD